LSDLVELLLRWSEFAREGEGMSHAMVLVHGGAHGAWCWEPLLPLLRPPVLAIDLPPKGVRGGLRGAPIPASLATIGIDDFARSVIADVDAAGIDRFVLVGHSMGGLTIAEVARRIPARVEHLVFVSCIAPREGQTMVDGLPEGIREMTRAALARARQGDIAALGVGTDEALQRSLFCNDMTEEQTHFVLDHCGPEAPRVFEEVVRRNGIPPDLPKTYVRLLRDQSLSPEVQDEQIANLRASPGGDVRVVELDTGHDVMVSRPDLLAAVLNRIEGE
jgi:pimeloyl-ACP methyl ester carboxylesterase